MTYVVSYAINYIMALEQATYHLGYTLAGEQPSISLHTHPAHLEQIVETRDDLAHLQKYLGMSDNFTFDAEAFGYAGVGRLEDSSHVAGWAALSLAIPKAESNGMYYGTPTPQLLPIVSTLSVALRHLNILDPENRESSDPKHPQLVTASLTNSVPLNEQYSAPLRATLSPDMLLWLELLPEVDVAEEQVRQALMRSFRYPYSHVREDDFRVELGESISFDYPGDGTGFFARRKDSKPPKGLTLNAANNDYPVQQIALLGGLAALNDIILEL